LLDQLFTSGQFQWRLRGAAGKLQLLIEPASLPEADLEREELAALTAGDAAGLCKASHLLLDLLNSKGALTLPFILREVKLPTPTVWQALEELMGKGLVTNDSFGPVRYLLKTKPEARIGAQGVLQPAVMAQMGRWSLLPPCQPTKDTIVQALLNRYGIVSREIVQAEGASWRELYPSLVTLEHLGRVKRGYFIKGLSGIQYALPQALAGLGTVAKQSGRYWALAWSDPANPWSYLSASPEEPENKKPTGDYLVFADGKPMMVASGQKIRLHTLGTLSPAALEKGIQVLINALDPVFQDKKLIISSFNGEPAPQSTVKEVLAALGFEGTYQKMTLWPSDRKVSAE
jgi:ATP-dependent Lhr-like helicase